MVADRMLIMFTEDSKEKPQNSVSGSRNVYGLFP